MPINISESSESFYKLTGADAKHLYKMGIFDAYAYVLMVVKAHGAAGWKWTFKVKDFCKEWEISKSTFYRVVSKLRVLNLLYWEPGETISVWHGAHIAKNPERDIKLLAENSLTSETYSPNCGTVSLTNETVVPIVGLEIAKKPATYSSGETPNSLQIVLNPTDNAVVESRETEEEETGKDSEPTVILEEPQPDPITSSQQEAAQLLLEREIFDSLRLLGIETNEGVRATMKKHAANVPSAITHIKQRYDNREKFGNITGAFVKACREGGKPCEKVASWGLHAEVNPPTLSQLAALEEAKNSGAIRDYFLSTDNICKVVLPNNFTQMPWWEYFS